MLKEIIKQSKRQIEREKEIKFEGLIVPKSRVKGARYLSAYGFSWKD